MPSVDGAGALIGTRVAPVLPGMGVSEKVTVPSGSTERSASAVAGREEAASNSAGINLYIMMFSSN
jgi:hypothetical protein